MSKYKNVRTNGFASKKESRRFDELKLLDDMAEISDLKCQVRYPLKVNGQLICTYVADFVYSEVTGGEVVEDVKGVRTPVYRIKAKLMKACYGIVIHET